MDTQFIKINGRYINVAHIIEIHTDGEYVRIVTSEQVSEGVGESDWVATSAVIGYRVGTPQADALLAWADRQSEVLA